MFRRTAILTLALLSAACAEARQNGQATQNQDVAAAAQPAPDAGASAGAPSPRQRDEALAFTNHPFVLGIWKVPEAHRPMMRCVQISSGTSTDLQTGEVEHVSRLSNRCTYPIRFTGEVGKSDASGTVCVPGLRAKTVLIPGGDFDLPVRDGNCFRDIEELAVEPGGA
jgi:hypothetical protein